MKLLNNYQRRKVRKMKNLKKDNLKKGKFKMGRLNHDNVTNIYCA